jgi:uncharacterized protein
MGKGSRTLKKVCERDARCFFTASLGRLTQPTVRLDQIVSVVATWAAKQPLVGRAWVFGSRARGEEKDESDIDIAVELDLASAQRVDESGGTATWMLKCGDWDSELASLFPVPVDLEQFMGAKTPAIKAAIRGSSVLAYTKQGFRGKPV